VGFVADVGGLNDKGFNQSTYEGMKRGANKIGAKLISIESTSTTDFLRNITTAAQQSDFVLVSGFSFANAIQRAAQQFPTKRFGIIDWSYQPSLKNVQGDVFASNQASYLAGVLAASVSKKHSIGFVGGENSELLHEFLAGYEAGALSVDKNVHIRVGWTGSWTNQQKGKEVALAEISQKADVIYTAAGASGLGGIKAAHQSNVWAIGVDTDQNYISPTTVISSVMKRVDVAAYDQVVAIGKGNWKSGTVNYNLANKGVGLAPYHGLTSKVPAKAKAAVTKASKMIISGKVKIPTVPKYLNGR
jgi:basic membrane protein A